jgi:hypothetical protein
MSEIDAKQKAQNRHDYLKHQVAITRRSRAAWRALPKAEQQRRNQASAAKARVGAAFKRAQTSEHNAEKAWRDGHRIRRKFLGSDLSQCGLTMITKAELRTPTYLIKRKHQRTEKERLGP